MKKGAIVIVAIALAVAVYYGAHRTTAGRTSNPGMPSSSVRAPTLTVVDLEGNTINTSSFAGHVVLVNFWAAWCTPCTEEIPKLIGLQEKYRAQGFRVIGISMDDRDSVLRAFYRSNRMNYPVVAGNEKIAEAYGGILGLPTTFLIGRDGNIRARYPGLADFSPT